MERSVLVQITMHIVSCVVFAQRTCLKHQKIFSLFIYFIYNYVFNFNSQLGLSDFDINTLYVPSSSGNLH